MDQNRACAGSTVRDRMQSADVIGSVAAKLITAARGSPVCAMRGQDIHRH